MPGNVLHERFNAWLKKAINILTSHGIFVNPDDVEVIAIKGLDVEIYTKNYVILVKNDETNIYPREFCKKVET